MRSFPSSTPHHRPATRPSTRRPHRTLGAAGVLLLLLGTGACGADEVAERATESAIERAAEEAASEGVDVDFDAEDGSVSIESSDGSFTSGTGALPQGFPEDIPIAEGEILQGASSEANGTTGWLVTVAVDQPGDEAVAEAGAALEAAGYTPGDNAMAMEGLSYAQYVGSEWEVILGATDDGGGGTLLSYTVTSPTS